MSVSTTRFSRRPAPLPAELTPLLGRDADAARLRELVTTPALRLVTVTGPGGVGKTRLALHVAALEDERPVAFVPLAATRDPQLVLPAIAQAFGVFTDVQDAPEDQIVTLLGDQPTLLVLDNLEQLPGASAPLARVLGRCPHLTVLATSQAPLGVSGEQLYPLAPLPTPADDLTSAETILASEAVALFVARARGVNPALVVDDRAAATIAEICRRLDGLPLAIELAAARTAILSPDALLARLANRLQVLGSGRRGVPDRLRTMRSAVAWSYDLLSPDEQALFRRLSVFEGGFSLDAIETIFAPCGGRDPFDLLSALVDHSLIQPDQRAAGEPRFLMLETLREFGLEQLRETGDDDAARLTHARFIVALAEAAEPHLSGHGQADWYDRLDTEISNLRAAIEWALAHGHEDLALRVGGSLWRFCSSHGLATDNLRWLEQALASDQAARSPHRALAYAALANLYEDRRELDRARAHFETARDLAAASGDTIGEATATIGIGYVERDRGNFVEARELLERAHALARRSGDRHTLARATGNLGTVACLQGDLAAAERHWEESRVIFSELGDLLIEATATSNLGVLAFERGDFALAARRQRRALELHRRLRSTRDIPYALINLGEVSALVGDLDEARACFAEAVAMLRQEGMSATEGVALNGIARLAQLEGDLPRAAAMVQESTRLVVEGDDQYAVVENAERLASICSQRGDHARAVELVAGAAQARAALGSAPTPLKQEEMNGIETAARAALGDDGFTHAWEKGSQLGLQHLPRRITTIAREIVGRQQAFDVPVANIPEPEPEPAIDHGLTVRETEVLRRLAQGETTAEIAEALFISPRTAETHIARIRQKLGVPSRTAAVAWALRNGVA